MEKEYYEGLVVNVVGWKEAHENLKVDPRLMKANASCRSASYKDSVAGSLAEGGSIHQGPSV